ncbi:uncharacterized protein LOC134180621 [Corticium candelabrum]|uniref:uncharacterized protein LOC134180621 n=1 Tax=Corticium candelabrum TaxID=121492 RepID=UPI002E274647|nr:uncharacterized protein LOC134180621 [Corticium candelabrum]
MRMHANKLDKCQSNLINVNVSGYPIQPNSNVLNAEAQFKPVVFITNVQLKWHDVKIGYPGTNTTISLPDNGVNACQNNCPLQANKTIHWSYVKTVQELKQYLVFSFSGRIVLADEDDRTLVCLEMKKESGGWPG